MYEPFFYGDELYHYGRKGMRWYQHIFQKAQARKQKKQRLSALEKARKARAEKLAKEKDKKRLLADPNAKELQARRSEFTNDELRKAIERLDYYKRIDDLSKSELTKGMNQVNRVMNQVATVNNWATTGLNVYKNIDQIMKLVSNDQQKKDKNK